MLASQAKALEWSARLVDSEQNFQNRKCCTFFDDESSQLQSNDAHYIYVNA